jgi:hypothetical protein
LTNGEDVGKLCGSRRAAFERRCGDRMQILIETYLSNVTHDAPLNGVVAPRTFMPRGREAFG